jgi:hypothetical protein
MTTDSNFAPRDLTKLPEDFIVHGRQESDAVYTLRDITIDEDSAEAPRHIGEYQQRERRTPSDHISQSERDWAYAKRALARDDHVEEIIRRIVDYRGDEKHANCARYTVEKAQLALRGPAASLESAERSPTHAIEPSHEP